MSTKRFRQEEHITQAVSEMEALGVTVFPVYSRAELAEKNRAVLEMTRNYPEFENSSNHPVMGGFGAHGTPSSYHHPVVQAIRMEVYERFSSLVIPVLAKNLGFPYWHNLFDRVCTRGPESGSVTAETWHFDHCDDRNTSNITKKRLTGGWVNLNIDEDQYFYGIKGKLGTDYIKGDKYRPIPKNSHAELDHLLNTQGGPIVVPPGHLICFRPELAHKVSPGRTAHLGVRLYVGTVMSEERIPLFNFDRDRILSNELGYTGSGQRPPMWASMSWVFRPEHIQAWTEKMKPNAKYLETVVVDPKGKGKNAGLKFTRIQRFLLQPVEVYGYTEHDLNIMLPMDVE